MYIINLYFILSFFFYIVVKYFEGYFKDGFVSSFKFSFVSLSGSKLVDKFVHI